MDFWKYLLIRFVWIAVALTVILGAIVSIFYSSEVKTTDTLLKSRETLNITSSKKAIINSLKDVTSDLMILSQHELFNQIEVMSDEETDYLAKDILTMMREKQRYDHIRYLDKTGMEVARVNFKNGQPHIVSRTKLQDKSNRYYFKETFELSKGEIFISPFDLNVEQGKFELPYKPMIRLGTPVFDKHGHKRGIVLINYFGEELIQDFLLAATNIVDHIALLNSDGYWLHNSEPSLEWSFMFDQQQSFKKLFPSSWQRIIDINKGQFIDSNGFFPFDTIYPLHANQDSGNNKGRNGNKKYYWKIVAFVPLANIHATESGVMKKLFRIVEPLYLIMVLGSFWLSYAYTKRVQAEGLLLLKNKSIAMLQNIAAIANESDNY